MKLKSSEMKEKLIEYISNPNNSSNTNNDRHVSSSDKGKPYRNLPSIFPMDKDYEINGKYILYIKK